MNCSLFYTKVDILKVPKQNFFTSPVLGDYMTVRNVIILTGKERKYTIKLRGRELLQNTVIGDLSENEKVILKDII